MLWLTIATATRLISCPRHGRVVVRRSLIARCFSTVSKQHPPFSALYSPTDGPPTDGAIEPHCRTPLSLLRTRLSTVVIL